VGSIVSKEKLLADVKETDEWYPAMELRSSYAVKLTCKPTPKELLLVHHGDSRDYTSTDAMERVIIALKTGQGYKVLIVFETQGGGDHFEDVTGLKTYGTTFIYFRKRYHGTGYFSEDYVFSITSNNELVQIKLDQDMVVDFLGKDEHFQKGWTLEFYGGKFKFQSFIYHQDDGNCCPSGGDMFGEFFLSGGFKFDPIAKIYSPQFKFIPTHISKQAPNDP